MEQRQHLTLFSRMAHVLQLTEYSSIVIQQQFFFSSSNTHMHTAHNNNNNKKKTLKTICYFSLLRRKSLYCFSLFRTFTPLSLPFCCSHSRSMFNCDFWFGFCSGSRNCMCLPVYLMSITENQEKKKCLDFYFRILSQTFVRWFCWCLSSNFRFKNKAIYPICLKLYLDAIRASIWRCLKNKTDFSHCVNIVSMTERQ